MKPVIHIFIDRRKLCGVSLCDETHPFSGLNNISLLNNTLAFFVGCSEDLLKFVGAASVKVPSSIVSVKKFHHCID